MSESNSGSKAYYGIVVGLVALALILGYAIFKQSGKDAGNTSQNQQNEDPGVQNSSSNQGSPETEVLKVPPAGATEDELRRHFELASSIAVERDEVVLENCKPSPLVLAVPQDSKFTIKNPDDTEHVIGFDLKTTFRVPAKGETQITADFPNGPGIYGYGCDSAPGVSGFFIVFVPTE